MALPVTLDHHDLEAPIDLVARLAVANGFSSLREFLDHTDVSARAIVAGDAAALDMVSQWSGVPTTRLALFAVAGNGQGATWRMGCATLSKEMRLGRRMRFCANCVIEEREMEAGRLAARAWRRAWWNVRGIEGCHVHDSAITEVDVGVDVDIHDLPHFIHANVAMIEAAAKNARPGRQPMLDRFLVDRIAGVEGKSLMHGLEVHVAADFARYLGEFLKLHQLEGSVVAGHSTAEIGYRVASRGEAEICRVIKRVIDQNRPAATHIEPVLGRMVSWLRRNLQKAQYQPVIDIVQDVLARSMPYGVGQVIFKPVSARHLYCVNSAHADFGLPHERIRALMKASDPDFREGLPDSRTYFDAVALRPILQAAKDTLTSQEAAAQLGVNVERVLDMLGNGILVPFERRDDDMRPYTRIHMDTVAELVRKIVATSVLVEDDANLITLKKATASLRRPFCAVLRLILAGKVRAYLIPGNDAIFPRIRLKHGALNIDGGKMAGGNEELMRRKEVEAVLGTNHGTINELVKQGLLRERSLKRETERVVRFIERASFEDFNANHVSLSAIRKARQGFRVKIIAELDALGIRPVNKAEGVNARFYRRDDLARAGYEI